LHKLLPSVIVQLMYFVCTIYIFIIQLLKEKNAIMISY